MTAGPEMSQERVAAIQAGETLFDSWGISRIKVTRQDRAEALEIPIRSTGIWELMDSLASQAPRPPARAEWIAADSDLGRQLGLDRDRSVLVFDTTDPDYLARLAGHHQEVLWRVLLAGLDLPILDEEGQPVADLSRQREILKANGLTEHQAEKIFKDIQALTRLEEEIEDFTSARP
ncbi:MAG: hypothetical protein JRJ59_08915 [Deltaproteobacteria bacterium]|nr:hypothetical protein [Deltaproteobacteria bacterium]